MAVNLRSLAPLLLAFAAFAAFAQDVGRVQFATGSVQVERGGQVIALRATDAIRRGDIVLTGSDGLVQLAMVDRAYISLRPGTRLRIDQYNFDPVKPGSDQAVLSLLVGVMRTFTGEIVSRRKDLIRMKTPLASVGVRGSGNILAHSDEAGTINHTLTGAHSVTALVDGYERTLVSYPGQTIQVRPGQPPRFIPTPPAILAATAPVTRATSGGGTSGSDTTASSTGGTASTGSTGSTGATGSGSTGSPGPAPTSTDPATVASVPPTSPTNTSGTSAALTGPTATGNTATSTSQATTATTTTTITTTQPPANADYEAVLRFYIPLPGGGYAGVLGNIASLDGGAAVFDSSGRLMRLDGASLGTFLSGPGATPPGYSDATYSGTVTFTGGQHADAFRSSDGSVILGRWTGALVSVDDGAGNRASFDLGSRSLAYVVTSLTPSSVLGAFTGTSTYSLAAATAPTDAAGNVGSVTSASMTANFGARTIAGNIALAINGGAYTLAGTSGLTPGDPHFTFASSTANLVITCTGTCSTAGYLGTVNGAFAGPTGQWMGINYRINPNRANGGPYTDFITGTLALNTLAPPKVLRFTQASYQPPRPPLVAPTLALSLPRPGVRRIR